MYWEFVILGRKLCIVAVAVALRDSASYQLACMLLSPLHRLRPAREARPVLLSCRPAHHCRRARRKVPDGCAAQGNRVGHRSYAAKEYSGEGAVDQVFRCFGYVSTRGVMWGPLHHSLHLGFMLQLQNEPPSTLLFLRLLTTTRFVGIWKPV